MRKIQYTIQRALGARRQYVRPEVEVLDVGESGPLMTSGGGTPNDGSDSNQATGNVYDGESLVPGGGFGYGGEEEGDDIIAE